MFDELLEANRAYATGFSLAGIPARAARRFGLVTCMDSRIEPLAMLGMVPGDAKIMRNAGARVTPDVLRSLSLAVALLGVEEVAVMQHTDCAMANRRDEDLTASLPPEEAARFAGSELLAMPDPDRSLRDDIAILRSSPLFPSSLRVQGWRYDVATGLISLVVPG